MPADGFKNLSPEQLQRLSKLLDEASALNNQRAEIIEEAITGEIEVGKLRISYLNEYFDLYSKGLDQIARKYSTLSDAFLILDNKINESYKKVLANGAKTVSDMNKAADKASQAKRDLDSANEDKKDTSDSVADKPKAEGATREALIDVVNTIRDSQQKQQRQHEESVSKLTDLLQAIAKVELNRAGLSKNEAASISDLLVNKFKEIATAATGSTTGATIESRDVNRGASSTSTEAYPLTTVDFDAAAPAMHSLSALMYSALDALSAITETAAASSMIDYAAANSGKTVAVKNRVSEDKRKELNTETLQDIDVFIGGFFEALHAENSAAADDAVAAFAERNSEIDSLDQYYLARETRRIAELAEQKQETTKQLLELEIARRDEATDGERRLAALQLARIQEVTSAELAAQKLINKIGATRDAEQSADNAEMLLQQKAAEDLQKNIRTLEEQRIASIANKRLELELATGRTVTAAELADITAEANAEYSLTEANIAKTAELRKKFGDDYFTRQIQHQNTLLAIEREKQQADKVFEDKVLAAKIAHQHKAAEEELKTRKRLGDLLAEQRYLDTNTAEIAEDRLQAIRLAHLAEASEAEIKSKKLLTDAEAAQSFEGSAEGASIILRQEAATELQKNIKALEEQRVASIANKRLELELAYGRKITESELADIITTANKEFGITAENLNKAAELRKKLGDDYFTKQREQNNLLLAIESEKQQTAEAAERRTHDFKVKNQRELAEAELQTRKRLNSLQSEQQYLAANESEVLENRIQSIRLANAEEVAKVELAAQKLLNDIRAEQQYATNPETANEAANLRARLVTGIANENALHELKKQKDAERANLELKSRRKNHGILTAEESKRIEKQLAQKYKDELAWQDKIREYQARKEEKEAKKEQDALRQKTDQTIANAMSFTGFDKYNNLLSRFGELRDLRDDAVTAGASSVGASLLVAVKALSSLAQQLESKIDEIASYKTAIDTRLQGSSNKKHMGSYWDQLVKDMTSIGAINPYYKQEDFAKNIKDLVNRGIAFDLEQRAFLMTIQEKIANTFNVADGTLLRLIRIQQEDSTAGRLGMEASMTEFLNNMYETTEYLSDVAASVRTSLEEMESLMSGAAATEVEYQVQKWLGSLYSVGMSQAAVNSISQTLGQIASGQIEGLTGGGAGNLLIMAANDANIPIADILTKGLDASETNRLMQAVVNYLAEIAESSKDNNVVQQQLANVFGVKASDLRAATNLASQSTMSSIFGEAKTYDNLLNKLFSMAGSMAQRTSLAEMMSNVWENGQYTLAGSVASSPAAYIIYKAASLLDSAVGGIDLPFANVMGFGVDLNTTVADLMRVASLSTGILGNIGSILSGLGGSFSGQSMLNKVGISSGSGLTVTPRGGITGGNVGAAGGTVSESGYTGNASGGDVLNSTMQQAEDKKKQEMIEAKEEEEENQVNVLNYTVLKIYELLDDVAHGKECFRVKVEGYGLTKGSSGTMGGVGALSALGYDNNASSGGAGSSEASSLSVSGTMDFGGWTTSI